MYLAFLLPRCSLCFVMIFCLFVHRSCRPVISVEFPLTKGLPPMRKVIVHFLTASYCIFCWSMSIVRHCFGFFRMFVQPLYCCVIYCMSHIWFLCELPVSQIFCFWYLTALFLILYILLGQIKTFHDPFSTKPLCLLQTSSPSNYRVVLCLLFNIVWSSQHSLSVYFTCHYMSVYCYPS